MNNKNTLILVAGLMAMVFVAASVFAYYPLSITVSPVNPPVKFVAGNNSNQTDLGPGNTIAVILGSNSASASVTIHPTYQTTYYKDVLKINHTDVDSKEYNVTIRVNSYTSDLPPGSYILLKIFDEQSGHLIKEVNLTSLSSSISNMDKIGDLDDGETWRVDIVVYIPEGSPISTTSATVDMELIYTPSSETPP
jgi:hypothetical protein